MLRYIMRKTPLVGRDRDSAFTLIELLVVIAIIAILAALLLPVLANSKETATRVACGSQLHQIGVGMNVYAGDNQEYVPQRHWPINQNIWQLTEVCRVNPGTMQITRGPYAMGLLWSSKTIPDGRTFYCPSLAKVSGNRNYEYYATEPNTWPSTPVGSADDNVRCGYSYYPQPKELEQVNSYRLPVLTFQSMIFTSPNVGDPVQTAISEPIPLKVTTMDPTRAVSADFVQSVGDIGHRKSGNPYGISVLYGDGHVQFVGIAQNKGLNMPFDPSLWGKMTNSDYTISSTAFRRLMYYFQP
jgi:prepilin-type N-terminal cleavage/methylation domain-containing protein